jgi:hypothetical protein
MTIFHSCVVDGIHPTGKPPPAAAAAAKVAIER